MKPLDHSFRPAPQHPSAARAGQRPTCLVCSCPEYVHAAPSGPVAPLREDPPLRRTIAKARAKREPKSKVTHENETVRFTQFSCHCYKREFWDTSDPYNRYGECLIPPLRVAWFRADCRWIEINYRNKRYGVNETTEQCPLCISLKGKKTIEYFMRRYKEQWMRDKNDRRRERLENRLLYPDVTDKSLLPKVSKY